MTRLNPFTAAPDELQRMVDYSAAAKTDLEPLLIHLVKLRASQLNGCARCIHMHTQEALKDGDRHERLYLLDAWRETSVYTPRERAALEWTEALTRLSETKAPDSAYDGLPPLFTPAEIVQLTMLINNINAWNRIAVGFRLAPIGLTQKEAA